ncbi:hypothetical protein KSP40_PGU002563 [Platanthera guangdongensis]|uniref:Uncharacterized protein n=1 Tax=Platanthera guangdongensis TaxID=2320717 RepID=A0ABR2M873_9ASPA
MEVVLSEEELRRRQREKQEKILTVLLGGRQGAGNWRRRWLPARSADGGDRGEVAEAALLLLSLSSAAISAHV